MNAYPAFTMNCGEQLINNVFYPPKTIYKFIDREGVEGLVFLSGKSEPGTRNRVNTTVGGSSYCATTRPASR